MAKSFYHRGKVDPTSSSNDDGTTFTKFNELYLMGCPSISAGTVGETFSFGISGMGSKEIMHPNGEWNNSYLGKGSNEELRSVYYQSPVYPYKKSDVSFVLNNRFGGYVGMIGIYTGGLGNSPYQYKKPFNYDGNITIVAESLSGAWFFYGRWDAISIGPNSIRCAIADYTPPDATSFIRIFENSANQSYPIMQEISSIYLPYSISNVKWLKLIDENFMAVGIAGEFVEIYKDSLDGTGFVKVQTIYPTDMTNETSFGTCIDYDGIDKLFINSVGYGVYVYVYDVNSEWFEIKKTEIPPEIVSTDELYGYRIRARNEKLIVTAPNHSLDASNENEIYHCGAVYVYDSSLESPIQIQKLTTGLWRTSNYRLGCRDILFDGKILMIGAADSSDPGSAEWWRYYDPEVSHKFNNAKITIF